jgi:hypothetical protein
VAACKATGTAAGDTTPPSPPERWRISAGRTASTIRFPRSGSRHAARHPDQGLDRRYVAGQGAPGQVCQQAAAGARLCRADAMVAEPAAGGGSAAGVPAALIGRRSERRPAVWRTAMTGQKRNRAKAYGFARLRFPPHDRIRAHASSKPATGTGSPVIDRRQRQTSPTATIPIVALQTSARRAASNEGHGSGSGRSERNDRPAVGNIQGKARFFSFRNIPG